jgi:DNA repair exonuclease SbcCD ATPase subunit
VKLLELHVDGFGKLVERRFTFTPGFNIVYGENEAGKSTLETALVATLYGVGRKEDRDAWRPWKTGARYATALRYQLADGREFEVQRDFERDPKGVRVYDRSGNDVSAEASVGKTVNPGHAHMRVPLEVFVNASCLTQGATAIDGARAERIATFLAQALDGGPREDAALGAISRLDRALADHVGTQRARVNAPLRKAQERIDELAARAAEVRAKLRELDELRARLGAENARAVEYDLALREHDRRAKAFRAQTLRARLEALREVRDDIAALQAERAQYGDVEDFPSGRSAELDARYREFKQLETFAIESAREAEDRRFTPALSSELSERAADGGAVDEATFAELERAANAAGEARAKATFAANRVQEARRAIEGGGELFGALVATSAVVLAVAVVFAILHAWIVAGSVGALAFVLLAITVSRGTRRARALRTVAEMQRLADLASGDEATTSSEIARGLERFACPTIEELGRRRARFRELTARRDEAQRAAARAANARARLSSAADAFDALARELAPPERNREAVLAAAKARDARRSARDGIDVRLSMLDVRRGDVLGDDDEYALEREVAELLAAGVSPAPLEGAASQRAFESERADLERRSAETRANAAATAATLAASEAVIGDLAAIDEELAALHLEAERLRRFERAVGLARATLDERTREAHQKFARRLEDYSSQSLATVTDERYADLRVDPTTLTVSVRVPETGAIQKLDRLSAGTRDQAYLVVRFAMARMFAEGMETPPILLDDPFAYWDEARVERGFPVIARAARDAQVVVFTTSRELADAAQRRGANRIDLGDLAATSFDRAAIEAERRARRKAQASDDLATLPLLAEQRS